MYQRNSLKWGPIVCIALSILIVVGGLAAEGMGLIP